jgi:hypothetical protein
LFDVCVAFASAPCPEKGWQWVLARFDRLANGEEKYSFTGKRRCNAIRQEAVTKGEWYTLYLGDSESAQRQDFVRRVLGHLSYDIDVKEVEKAAGLLCDKIKVSTARIP